LTRVRKKRLAAHAATLRSSAEQAPGSWRPRGTWALPTEERFGIRALRRGLAALAGSGLLLSFALLCPSLAGAFPLAGCELTLLSYDAAGVQIDQAVGSGADATQQDPLQVAWDGYIAWTRAGSQQTDGGSWQIDVYGLPTMLRGNDAGMADGSLRIRDSMSFRFSGLFYVSGQVAGTGRSCSGGGWIRVVGDPLTTLPFTLSLALLLVGLVLLAVAARGRWLAAIFGGLMIGFGIAMLLVSYAALPFAQATPYLAIGGGMLIALAAGAYGSIWSRQAA
jgi:hypothetical protein